jgi:hypothetical protein
LCGGNKKKFEEINRNEGRNEEKEKIKRVKRSMIIINRRKKGREVEKEIRRNGMGKNERGEGRRI